MRHKPGSAVQAAAALGLLLACTQAFGSLGAHYAGTSPDKTQVQLYLDGGKFLGQKGGFHTLQTDIRILQNRRAVTTTDRCLYIYNPTNHALNRIECAARAGTRLGGVVYTVDPKRFKESGGEVQEMRCTQGCNCQVPKVLQLEADADNG